MADVQCVADIPCHTGEGPLWHPDERRLYWTDIPNGRLYRYDPASGRYEECLETEPIGGFTVEEDGALVLFQAAGRVRRWQDGELRELPLRLQPEASTRFNDCVAAPHGGVFAGTMAAPDHASRLYQLNPRGEWRRLLDDASESNGMDFSPDLTRLYWTDTHRRTIYRFDYDADRGTVGARRVFVTVPDDPGQGIPDGLCVDAAGGVWSARWNGGCVVRYSPEGEELQRVSLPTGQVSSLAFGGEGYRDLYITTSGGQDRRKHGALAGSLFCVRPATPGRAPLRSRLQQAGVGIT